MESSLVERTQSELAKAHEFNAEVDLHRIKNTTDLETSNQSLLEAQQQLASAQKVSLSCACFTPHMCSMPCPVSLHLSALLVAVVLVAVVLVAVVLVALVLAALLVAVVLVLAVVLAAVVLVALVLARMLVAVRCYVGAGTCPTAGAVRLWTSPSPNEWTSGAVVRVDRHRSEWICISC